MFLLCVEMVYLCENINVKLVDIDSGDQLRVCWHTYISVHVIVRDVCWDDVNIEGRPHAFYWRLWRWSFAFAIYAYIEHFIFDRNVQVRTNEICLFVMREYIKTIPKYTKISVYSVRFSYRINNHSKFIEHGQLLWYFPCFTGYIKVII